MARRTRRGARVPGASVQLEHGDLGESIAQWIEQGRVQAPSGGMRTDGQGKLSVIGIPRGTYRYQVHAPDGQAAGGELVVQPHAVSEHKIQVQ